MRLAGKQLLLLVCDGVEQEEVEILKREFEGEYAKVWLTTPQQYITVESICNGRRGKDLLIDLPFEAVPSMQFDGLIIPDGMLSTEALCKDKPALELVYNFHQQGLPIFASGNAIEVLYESRVLSQQILVREGTPVQNFVDQAVEVLLDFPLKSTLYRPEYRPTM